MLMLITYDWFLTSTSHWWSLGCLSDTTSDGRCYFIESLFELIRYWHFPIGDVASVRLSV